MPLFVLNAPYETEITQPIRAQQLDTDRVKLQIQIGLARQGVSLQADISLVASSDEPGAPALLKAKLAEVAEELARFRGVIP
jgi:hypothetical protein